MNRPSIQPQPHDQFKEGFADGVGLDDASFTVASRSISDLHAKIDPKRQNANAAGGRSEETFALATFIRRAIAAMFGPVKPYQDEPLEAEIQKTLIADAALRKSRPGRRAASGSDHPSN
jgi:hypothetical protein